MKIQSVVFARLIKKKILTVVNRGTGEEVLARVMGLG